MGGVSHTKSKRKREIMKKMQKKFYHYQAFDNVFKNHPVQLEWF